MLKADGMLTRKERRKGMDRQNPFQRDGLHKPITFGAKALASRKTPPILGIADRVARLHAMRVGGYGQF